MSRATTANRPAAEPAPGGTLRSTVAFTGLIAVTPAMPHVAVAGSFLDYSDITTVAAAIVGILAVLRSGAWRGLTIRRAPEAYAVALMVPFTLIAAVHAESVHSLAAGPARWLLNAIVIALAYLLLRTAADGRRMIRWIVLVATFEAVFGLVSYAVRFTGPGGYIGISYTEGLIGGMEVWGRITGTTAMAATFVAGLFALALPAAVGESMATRGRARWLWGGCAVVIFLALLFTLSRTPIGLAVVAVAALLLAATRPRVWVPVAVVLAVIFLATPLRARMTNFDTDRLALWDAGWRMFVDHWFFGVGPDKYMDYFDAYKDTPFGVATATPHNSLLYVAAESGVLAPLALAAAIALSLRFLRTRNPVVLGPMLGLAAFMVDAMTTNLYSIPSVAIAAWMMAPAVAPLIRAARSRGEPPDRPPDPAASSGTGTTASAVTDEAVGRPGKAPSAARTADPAATDQERAN